MAKTDNVQAQQVYDVGQMIQQRIQTIGVEKAPSLNDWQFVCNHYDQLWNLLQADFRAHGLTPGTSPGSR